jgi:outer membrane protein
MWKWKYATTACLSGLTLIAGSVDSAHAQAAGDNVVSLGWAHVAPQTGSGPLTVTSVGGTPVNMPIPGSGSGARSADLPAFIFEHYITNQIGVAFLGGWPGRMQLEGRGVMDSYGVLGDTRTWAPEVVLRYHFGQPDSRFRPFVGVGVNYTWFTDTRVTNSDFVEQSFGPGGTATAHASSSWNPVVQAGLDYQISKRWSVDMLVAYIPTDTNVTLTGKTAGGTEIVSHAKVRLHPIVTFLGISYKF